LFRKESAEIGQTMWLLTASNPAAFCGHVWVEDLGGFRKESLRAFHRQAMANFPFLQTSHQAYERAADLLATHPRLGPGDAIIAATALENKCALFTLDRDFSVLTSEGLILY
ncbi:MAG: PIN domain-containing protein, partial [Deltaproteobacteria bacterium]|nr:PIN domain-containing protein [Deltaproteobacteria bacterium]